MQLDIANPNQSMLEHLGYFVRNVPVSGPTESVGCQRLMICTNESTSDEYELGSKWCEGTFGDHSLWPAFPETTVAKCEDGLSKASLAASFSRDNCGPV